MARAVHRPIPLAAPVTRTFFPLIFMVKPLRNLVGFPSLYQPVEKQALNRLIKNVNCKARKPGKGEAYFCTLSPFPGKRNAADRVFGQQ